MIDTHPPLPYFAVIFTSVQGEHDPKYLETNDLLMGKAKDIKGFIGVESARNELGITVSYWKSLDSIAEWKSQTDHLLAQEKGRDQWYDRYRVRVCKVERDYEFKKDRGYVR